MSTGIVKWFDTTKKYGFIQPDQGDKDVFVHITALSEAGISFLKEGQKVILPQMGPTKFEHDGEEYYICPEKQILAIIND